MRVNLADGRTLTANRVPDPQDDVTAVLLDATGVTASVGRPRGAKRVAWTTETTDAGERVDVQADGVRLTVISYRSGFVRIEARLTGVPRWLAPKRNER